VGKIILLAALVLSGCGYYIAPRYKRFNSDLYIGMPVAELEALAGEQRGIQFYDQSSQTIVGFKETGFLNDLSSYFPIDIQ